MIGGPVTIPDNQSANSEPDAATELSADCYSDGERKWMVLGQRLRATLLKPLLQVLSVFRVSPDTITLLSAIAGLAFVPLVFTDYVKTAIGMLVVHILLDGLDGPLARHQHRASSRGSFTDTCADQLVVTAVTIAWMIGIGTKFAVLAGSVFIVVYALVVAMAMVRNAMEIPYSWLIRPRFMVYAAVAIDISIHWQLTLPVLAVCDILLLWKALTGFRALRRTIPGPVENSHQRHNRSRPTTSTSD